MSKTERMLGSRVAMALGFWVAYLLAFWPAYRLMGPPVVALAILPVVVMGWLFGTWAGLSASLLVFPLAVLLISLAGGPAWNTMSTGGGLLGSVLLVLIGAVVGRLRDLGELARRELIGRKRAEQELHRSLEELLASEEALQQRNRELALLTSTGQAPSSTLELDGVLVTILEEVRRMLGVVACSLWLIDPETDELVCRQASGPRSEAVRGWRLAPGEGLAGWVARSGESLIVADAEADERSASVNVVGHALRTTDEERFVKLDIRAESGFERIHGVWSGQVVPVQWESGFSAGGIT